MAAFVYRNAILPSVRLDLFWLDAKTLRKDRHRVRVRLLHLALLDSGDFFLCDTGKFGERESLQNPQTSERSTEGFILFEQSRLGPPSVIFVVVIQNSVCRSL